MPLTKRVKHIFEPTPLQCGQAVLAMLTDLTVSSIVDFLNNDRETDLKEMFKVLESQDIEFVRNRVAVTDKKELPPVAILSLQTPKCWHWSLYFEGVFYDPEYGVLNDFPPSDRRYYWEIKK